MLNELLKEMVARAGGPKRTAEKLREAGHPITATAISNYISGARMPTNTMVALLLDLGSATQEEAAAAWVAAGVPAVDLAGGAS